MSDTKSSFVRGVLPEVMFVPDVALALAVKPSAARKAILRGDCGPYLRLGRRLAVRRESFLATLAAREVLPECPTRLGRPPAPSPKYLKLLKSRKKGAGR